MDLLKEFLGQVKYSQSQEQILELLSIDITKNRYIASLNQSSNLQDHEIDTIVESMAFFEDKWLAFNELVISFIKLSRDINPWSVLESFDLYTTYLNDLSVAFNNQNYGHLLTSLVKNSIQVIVPMAIKLDFQLYYKENCVQPRSTYLASILLKMFNHIRSQSANASNGPAKLKSTILLFLGNRLCIIYFKLGNPLLCQNIFSNMNNANLKMKSFAINEQIQYRYYLARFYMIKNQFADAYTHFQWCLEMIIHMPRHPNFNLVLKYYIPVGILMGKCPNIGAFESIIKLGGGSTPGFLAIYDEISRAIKSGNFNLFINTIQKHEIFLTGIGVYISLGQKSIILVMRNLMRLVWRLMDNPIRITYEEALVALNLSCSQLQNQSRNMFTFITHPINITAAENILMTLIDQNLIKGKLSSNRAVLAKINVFPPVSTIYFVRFGNGSETALGHKDKWMNE